MDPFETLGDRAIWEIRFYSVIFWIIFIQVILNGYWNISRIGAKCQSHSTLVCWTKVFQRFTSILQDLMRFLILSVVVCLYRRVSTGKFCLICRGMSVEDVLKDFDPLFLQIFHIHMCYDNEDDFKRDRDRYQTVYKKIYFHRIRRRDLQPYPTLPCG